jgi:hypothetical protein
LFDDDDDDDDERAIRRERAARLPYSAAVADDSEEMKYLQGQDDVDSVVLELLPVMIDEVDVDELDEFMMKYIKEDVDVVIVIVIDRITYRMSG